MTGMQALETAVDAINRGEIFRYVQKPFDASSMRGIVDEAVARHRELALVAADRDVMMRRAQYYTDLEDANPGITAVERDGSGVYVIPDVCNADALRMLAMEAP